MFGKKKYFSENFPFQFFILLSGKFSEKKMQWRVKNA